MFSELDNAADIRGISPVELRQLRQFIVLAESKSFRVAAERLFMAQPPLSVAIKKLEEEVGTLLVERTTKGIKLTPAGEAALIDARRCLREAERFGSTARAAGAGESGEIHIAFISSVTFGLLPRTIRQFQQQYPDVRLVLHEANNKESFERIESGEFDLAFVRQPALPPSGVHIQSVERDHLCLAVPSGHRLAMRKNIHLHEVADEAFIGYIPTQAGGGLAAACTALCREHNVQPHYTQKAMQVSTVIGLVEGGLGLALVPAVHAQHASSRVRFCSIIGENQKQRIGIGLAYRAADETQVSRRFREVSRNLKA